MASSDLWKVIVGQFDLIATNFAPAGLVHTEFDSLIKFGNEG